jgi:hypothetical protein
MGSEKIINIRPALDTSKSKAGKVEQIINILAATVDLDAVDIEELDLIIQHGNKVGEQFTSFLRTIEKSIIDEGLDKDVNESIDEAERPTIIRINRTELFDPAQFIHHKGLEIDEQDERSIMLEEIDPSAIALESMLQGNTIISGNEHLKRLKQTEYVRLDAKIFQTFWENQHIVPEHWKGTKDYPNHIFFDGTVLRNQHGKYVICMYWAESKKWKWTYCRLDLGGWNAKDLSAVFKTC